MGANLRGTLSRLPMPLQEVYEWQYSGACRAADPELFFAPDAERGPTMRSRESAAKQVCAGCPVIEQCLDHALRVQETHGIWGGLTTQERLALRQLTA